MYIVNNPLILTFSMETQQLILVLQSKITKSKGVKISFLHQLNYFYNKTFKCLNFLLAVQYIIYIFYSDLLSEIFKTGFWAPNHLLNLRSSAVNSQRLLCSQKALFIFLIKIKNRLIQHFPVRVYITFCRPLPAQIYKNTHTQNFSLSIQNLDNLQKLYNFHDVEKKRHIHKINKTILHKTSIFILHIFLSRSRDIIIYKCYFYPISKLFQIWTLITLKTSPLYTVGRSSV